MYRFQVYAVTQPGETIALVGSNPAMGLWDVAKAPRLSTRSGRYPLWSVDLELESNTSEQSDDQSTAAPAPRTVEYKYARILPNGRVEWEAWGVNRWVPLESGSLSSPIVVDDGWLGTIPPCPYGYFANPVIESPAPVDPERLKIVVIGSSVALGCSSWLLRGWAWHLGQALQRHYGHQLINVSEIGANVSTTIARFSHSVTPEQPDIVVIALSLGNEGLAFSSPQQQPAIQRRFENGLQQLIKMTREIGAYPMLGGLYPNDHYDEAHYQLLQDTRQRMLSWGVPVLDWLPGLDNGQGRWQPGLSYDAAHPNSAGHQRMYEAIDLNLFSLTRGDLATQHPPLVEESSIYQDNWGFHAFFCKAQQRLRLINTTGYSYQISPGWRELQSAVQAASIPAGLYIAEVQAPDSTPVFLRSLFVQEDGSLETELSIPANADLNFYPTFHFFAPQRSQVLFYDGHLGILKIGEQGLYIINESDHEYNIQPMWREVRAALKAMPSGVYEDPHCPDAPFRTLMVGQDGLESRVKAPARSAIFLQYRCSLSEVSRVAIVPLGDRCAVRMLLYKMEYDGPAFPFDLTRTTNLADVADIIQNDFQDMWNPVLLHYNHDARRIYHTKWTGLSFAHEVEDNDDPVNDMSPVYERMRSRYSARSRRFNYTVQHCDKALFVRTGICDRGTVIDLAKKLEAKFPGKPFRLLLLSPQSSEEFANLPNVLHYNVEFNPDRMYEDLTYWLDCTAVMRDMLNSLGISSRNLFWCPPNLPQA
jgi:lysophospholipase L1-like esterase